MIDEKKTAGTQAQGNSAGSQPLPGWRAHPGLVWDEADDEFAEITTDSSRILIGTARDYASGALNYFDWTAATEYHVPLIRWSPATAGTDPIFWPTPGFILHVRYVCAAGGTPQLDLTISGVFEE